MLHLLKIEWLKVKNYKTFWVFIILYAFGIVGINYIGFYINELASTNVPMGEAILGSPFSFPKVWNTTGYMSSWLLYFPGILFIMLLTNEFNFKTHRQNIIDGWKRSEFITVKFVFALIFSAIATIFIFLVGLIMGLLAKNSVFTFEGMEAVGYIFIQTLAYITFAMFLAILLRRSGAAIAVFFLYGLIFEWIITALVNFQLKISPAGYFLPLQTTDSLLPLPFGKDIIYKDLPHLGIMLAASIFYIAAYYVIALKKFKKDDL